MEDFPFPVLRSLILPYRYGMKEKKRTYGISEVASELGISTVWLRKGEQRGFFPPARRHPTNGHRYYTQEDVERLKARRARRTGGRREGGGASRG